MSVEGGSYERLPGRGRHVVGRDELWIAADHLLLARQRGYSETYQRFYFDDIQALTITSTSRRSVEVGVTGGLGLVCATWAGSTAWVPGKVMWGLLAAAFLIYALISWLRGPTAKGQLVTRLQRIELRSLNRERVARRVLARLKEEIEAVQGDVSSVAAEPPPLVDSAAAEVTMEPAARPARRFDSPPPLPSTYGGLWHYLLFTALLADSGVTSWQLSSPESAVASTVALFLFLGEVVLAVIAILRQRVVQVSRRVAQVTKVALGALIVLMLAGWFGGMVVGFRAAMEAAASGEAIEPMNPFALMGPLAWGSLVTTTAVGLAGLAALLVDRRRRGEGS